MGMMTVCLLLPASFQIFFCFVLFCFDESLFACWFVWDDFLQIVSHIIAILLLNTIMH
jgi:hypothetical protein